MKKRLPLAYFSGKIKCLFTDIDDTLTDLGRIEEESYRALCQIKAAGISLVPVTGRPAGWCDMIARTWPVEGVVGENGAFYFCYRNRKMHRYYAQPEQERVEGQKRLEKIKARVLSEVPGSAVAADQFCRLFDLAIDFCEDVPALSREQVRQIKQIFEEEGATAKISSIHVNGWYGEFDKLSTSLRFAEKELQIPADQLLDVAAFVGDSPNDEPMFKHFKHSFAVANIKNFLDEIEHEPQYIADLEGGQGFHQIAQCLLKDQA